MNLRNPLFLKKRKMVTSKTILVTQDMGTPREDSLVNP